MARMYYTDPYRYLCLGCGDEGSTDVNWYQRWLSDKSYGFCSKCKGTEFEVEVDPDFQP